MELLFAFYNVEFAKKIKAGIQANGKANVVDIVSSEEDLLTTLALNPEITGVLLTTDIATKLKVSRLEVLVDVLSAAREQFPNVIFTVLSSEKIGHPLLAELVELGIYNIFVKNVDEFTIQSIFDSYIKPFSFNTAVKHRQVNPSIPWRRNLHKNTLRVEIGNSTNHQEPPTKRRKDSPKKNDDTSDETPVKQIDFRKLKPKRIKLQPRNNREQKEKVIENQEWLLDDLSLVMNRKPDKIIGTVVIGVTTVAPHLGSTHTAISIANYLSKLGHMVALVEGNHTQDFDRIHALVEGEKRLILHESKFELNGIDHFKYREEQELADIFSLYEYVVLDLGILTDSPYIEEFKRAHVKCVVASHEEWKFHWIEEFQMSYGSNENYSFLVPGASTSSVKDLIDRMDYRSVYSFPIQDSPYGAIKDSEELLEELIGEFINNNKKSFSKGALVLTGVLSVLTTLLIVMIFWFLD